MQEVPQVRPQIIEEVAPILYDYFPLWKGLPEYDCFMELLKILEIPISKSDEYLREIARSVIVLGRPLILMIGAGFSYDVMPITNELEPLLMQLLREADVSSPKQMIYENDKVWKIVRENSGRFKDMFSGWCAKMRPTFQHKFLARMIHEKQVSHIISFNWDNLIEKAYFEEYGMAISKVTEDVNISDESCLWKLHGDVENLAGSWIFPYEQGRIFESLIESLNRTIDRYCPQFALIVGYGEWEEVIRDRLIQFLQDNIPTVFRIRPNWNPEDINGINETAKRFFERLFIYFKMQTNSK